MSDLIVGALLFILGFLTSFSFTVKSISTVLKKLADKYENGDVDRLLK